MLKEQFLPTEFKFKENSRIAGMNVNPKIVKRIEAPFLINRLHIIGWEKNNFRSRCEKREVSVRFLSHFTGSDRRNPFCRPVTKGLSSDEVFNLLLLVYIWKKNPQARKKRVGYHWQTEMKIVIKRATRAIFIFYYALKCL